MCPLPPTRQSAVNSSSVWPPPAQSPRTPPGYTGYVQAQPRFQVVRKKGKGFVRRDVDAGNSTDEADGGQAGAPAIWHFPILVIFKIFFY